MKVQSKPSNRSEFHSSRPRKQTQAGEKHKTGQCRKSCSETMFIEESANKFISERAGWD